MRPDGDRVLKIALKVYAQHLRHEVGYSEGEATLMLEGFAVGWKAHENAMLMAVDKMRDFTHRVIKHKESRP